MTSPTRRRLPDFRGEEVGGGYVKRPSKAVNYVKRRIPLAALDPGDIGTVEVRVVRKVFLRPAMSDPQITHARAEGGAVGRNGHRSTLSLG